MHRHEVKVSPEEEARLTALAERHRITVPRLLVEAALSEGGAGAVPAARRELFMELAALQRLVGTVAVTVDGLARHAATTGQVRAEAAEALARARDVIVRIDRFLAGMAGRGSG